MAIRVKICGLTNYEDTALAVSLGADVIGFIFAQSPRKVAPETVAGLLRALSAKGLRDRVITVGVFVNEKQETIERVLRQTGLDTVQLHGDEKSTDADRYPFNWYKALRISSKEDVDTVVVKEQWHCSRLLVDAMVAGLYGGTGKKITVDVARYAKKRVKDAGKEFFLAGGITPENVYTVLNAVQPDGIDVGSGVEETPGKKSVEKMERLLGEIKRYEND